MFWNFFSQGAVRNWRFALPGFGYCKVYNMNDAQLVNALFDIASDHDRSREDRSDAMVPLLLSVEKEKFSPDAHIWRNTDAEWPDFKPQVLKNREAEQAFFVAFVQKIISKYEDVHFFRWLQSQDHPGYWGGYFTSFDLLLISINNEVMIPQLGLEDAFRLGKYVLLETPLIVSPPLELIHSIQNTTRIPILDAHNKAQEMYAALVKHPFDIFLIFLQSLHSAYHTNYFIDLFGWFSNVHIDKNGLLLRDAVWEPFHSIKRG